MKNIIKISIILFLLTSIRVQFAEGSDKEILTVWAMGVEGEKIVNVSKKFEKLYPGVKIVTQAIPWNAAYEKLITAIAGGFPPDVFQLGSTWVPKFTAMGALLPLEDYIKKSSIISSDKFFQGPWDINVIDKKNYGIPWYVDTRVLFYRTDILKEVGYDHPPKDWRELKDVCKKLKRDINNDGQIDRYGILLGARDWVLFTIVTWQNGGGILTSDNTKPHLITPENQEAMQTYVDFFKEKYTPLEMATGTDLFNSFKTGFIPMFISGPWMLQELHKQVPQIDGKWDVALLPKNKTSTSFVGGSSLVISSISEHKEMAWKFIEFMNQPAMQVEWYKETTDLPSLKEAWNDPYFADKDKIKIFGEQLKDARGAPAVAQWEEIAEAINKHMEEAVYQKITVDKMFQNLNSEVKNILTLNRKEQSALFKISILALIFLSFVGVIVLYMKTCFKEKTGVCMKSAKPSSKVGVFAALKTYKSPYLFIFPSILLFIVFVFSPVFLSFIMSLTNLDIYTLGNFKNISFIGFYNYKSLLLDPLFWKAIMNTFYFVTVAGPLSVAMSLLMAILLNSSLVKFRTFFRVGYFTPVVTTMVAVAIVWRWLYNPQYGVINWMLGLIGLPGKSWLGDVNWAMPALIVMAAWKNFGYNMIIFLAGLQGIPSQCYEAAEIDGAGRFHSFLHITLPLLKPTIFFVTIMTTIGYFQFFAEPYIMTDGGPLNSTVSVVLLMYREAFKFFKMGYASAIAYILFGFIVVFSLLQFKLGKTSFEY